MKQETFDLAIGRLDYALSVMLLATKDKDILPENAKTLIHHAEDMLGAAGKILEKLVSAEARVLVERAVAEKAVGGIQKVLRDALLAQPVASTPLDGTVWNEEADVWKEDADR